MFGNMSLNQPGQQSIGMTIQPPVFSKPSPNNMFGGLNIKDGAKPKVVPVVEEPVKVVDDGKPKDAWALGKDLIKF